jgi:hypothetical protein
MNYPAASLVSIPICAFPSLDAEVSPSEREGSSRDVIVETRLESREADDTKKHYSRQLTRLVFAVRVSTAMTGQSCDRQHRRRRHQKDVEPFQT